VETGVSFKILETWVVCLRQGDVGGGAETVEIRLVGLANNDAQSVEIWSVSFELLAAFIEQGQNLGRP
jgi:hypothetical protein